VRQAAHERDLARDELEVTRRALVRETQAQYQAVVSGVALMESTRAAVAAADQALASTRAGQGLGTRTMTDLLLAIQTQAAAQNAHDQARHGHVLARLLLQQAAGALGEAELAAVNQLLLPEGAS
jgi:outer membrane protein